MKSCSVLLAIVIGCSCAVADSRVQHVDLDGLVSRSSLIARFTILSAEVVGQFGKESCGVIHRARIVTEGEDNESVIVFVSYEGYRVGEDYLIFLSAELPYSDKMIELLNKNDSLLPDIRNCSQQLMKNSVSYSTTSMEARFRIVESSIDSSQEWILFDPTVVFIDEDRYEVRVERISDCVTVPSSCALLRQRHLVSLESMSVLMSTSLP